MIRLDATSLPRFMACRGNIELDVPAVPSSADDTVRNEGNAFHKVAELIWHGADPATLLNTKAYNGVMITAEMLDHAQEYLAGLDRRGWIETDTSWQRTPINLKGRADYASYIDGMIDIVDAKYGYREVDPEMHWTLISHAIGIALRVTGLRGARFRIYQPRAFHPDGPWRVWEIDGLRLHELMELVLEQAQAPQQLTTSEHCRDCSKAAFCPALRNASMNVLEAVGQPVPDRMTAEQVAQQLTIMARAESIIKVRQDALENLALYLIQQGQVLPGWGMDDRYGHTTWVNGLDADQLTDLLGQDMRDNKVISPAEAKRRGVSEDMIKALTTRPHLGRKLTRIDANKAVKRLLKGK